MYRSYEFPNSLIKLLYMYLVCIQTEVPLVVFHSSTPWIHWNNQFVSSNLRLVVQVSIMFVSFHHLSIVVLLFLITHEWGLQLINNRTAGTRFLTLVLLTEFLISWNFVNINETFHSFQYKKKRSLSQASQEEFHQKTQQSSRRKQRRHVSSKLFESLATNSKAYMNPKPWQSFHNVISNDRPSLLSSPDYVSENRSF